VTIKAIIPTELTPEGMIIYSSCVSSKAQRPIALTVLGMVNFDIEELENAP